MIHTNRTVAVGDQESKIDSPIILYRGDREVEVEFTINGSKFTFTNGGNVIKSTNATHGQLVINTPTGENMFSEVTECHDGKVVFIITKEMIDELTEVGFYSFQIRLFDESQVSRVTIPPVLKGIDIRNPIAAEDETNVVDIGLVDYAVVVKDEFEDLSTFLPDGNYNKTEWESKDVISGAKLNKIEDALYNINSDMEATDLALLNRVENINKNIQGEINRLETELESEVEEFERGLNGNFETFKHDIEYTLDDEIIPRIEPIESDRDNKYGVHKITRKTKKIFDDGCVLNVNNTGKAAEVCGFRTHDSISTYPDRDAVMVYIDGELPKCEILEVVEFGEKYVKFNGHINEIEIGMIIDCMNQSEIDEFDQREKYSGFVVDFNEDTIYVSGWYKYQDASPGQIPDKNRIIINPVTRLWGKNVNVFLNEDSFGWGGVGCEYGLFNSKSVSKGVDYYNLCGVDVVNFKGVCGVGYHIRKENLESTTKTLIGYKSDNSEEAFVSNNSNVAGFTSNGDKVGFIADLSEDNQAFKTSNGKFVVYGDGCQGAYYAKRHVYDNNATIDPNNGYIHFIGSGVNILPDPPSHGSCIIKIMSTSDDCVLKSSNGEIVTSSGNVSTYTLKAWNTIEMYCDTTSWYILENK